MCVMDDLMFSVYVWKLPSVKSVEKQLQQMKDSDPVMVGIQEEVSPSQDTCFIHNNLISPSVQSNKKTRAALLCSCVVTERSILPLSLSLLHRSLISRRRWTS